MQTRSRVGQADSQLSSQWPLWGLPLASWVHSEGVVPLPGHQGHWCWAGLGGAGREHSDRGSGPARLVKGAAQPWCAVASLSLAPCLRGEVHVPGPRVLRCFPLLRGPGRVSPVSSDLGLTWGSTGQGMCMGTPPRPPEPPACLCPPGPGVQALIRPSPVLTCPPVSVPRLPVEDFSLDSSLSQ